MCPQNISPLIIGAGISANICGNVFGGKVISEISKGDHYHPVAGKQGFPGNYSI